MPSPLFATRTCKLAFYQTLPGDTNAASMRRAGSAQPRQFPQRGDVAQERSCRCVSQERIGVEGTGEEGDMSFKNVDREVFLSIFTQSYFSNRYLVHVAGREN